MILTGNAICGNLAYATELAQNCKGILAVKNVTFGHREFNLIWKEHNTAKAYILTILSVRKDLGHGEQEGYSLPLNLGTLPRYTYGTVYMQGLPDCKREVVKYSRITSTKSPSFSMTTFCASLANATTLQLQSRDCSYYLCT